MPVFRYALERDTWHPAPYSVFLFHRGELTPDGQMAKRILEQAAKQDAGVPANILFQAVDAESPVPERLEPLWDRVKNQSLPRLVVCSPGNLRPLWTAEVTEAAARMLLDSPARREIQRDLARGDAGIWVWIESGDAEKDAAAEKVLRQESDDFAETFRFPPEAVEAMKLASVADARISFSQVRIRRDDPTEGVLKTMLLATEPDLAGLSEPMAFLVFGRGRTLWALVGKGISPKNVRVACAYITGDCSCEVKANNPGLDLLFRADWYKILAGVAPEPFAPDEPTDGETSEMPVLKHSSRTVIVTGVLLALVVLVGSLIVRRRGARGV
ncbi:MAG: hypothetical protein JXA11_15905 [Phycisphaerae bacterium]|nr:hypothetical protein [Phycisphaerae bacterium]